MASESSGNLRIYDYVNSQPRLVITPAGRIGIGTSAPQEKLHVEGNAYLGTNQLQFHSTGGGGNNYIQSSSGEWLFKSRFDNVVLDAGNDIANGNNYRILFRSGGVERMRMDSYGNFGIGTNVPQEKLDVRGNIYVDTYQLQFHSTGGGGKNYVQSVSGEWLFKSRFDNIVLDAGNDFANGNNYRIVFKSGGIERMRMDGFGNVGIGTENPDAKLAVKGTVHAQEVRVDLQGAVAPDYVFDDAYELPSLENVEAYIKEHKHLPEVPSAKEMDENGLNLKEMNLLLLKKVEELTLHIIEQDKRINLQQKQLHTQHEELEHHKRELKQLHDKIK
jgi:hypothetical protein